MGNEIFYNLTVSIDGYEVSIKEAEEKIGEVRFNERAYEAIMAYEETDGMSNVGSWEDGMEIEVQEKKLFVVK